MMNIESFDDMIMTLIISTSYDLMITRSWFRLIFSSEATSQEGGSEERKMWEISSKTYNLNIFLSRPPLATLLTKCEVSVRLGLWAHRSAKHVRPKLRIVPPLTDSAVWDPVGRPTYGKVSFLNSGLRVE